MQSIVDATERALLRQGLVKRIVTRVCYRKPDWRSDSTPHQGKKECERRRVRIENAMRENSIVGIG